MVCQESAPASVSRCRHLVSTLGVGTHGLDALRRGQRHTARHVLLIRRRASAPALPRRAWQRGLAYVAAFAIAVEDGIAIFSADETDRTGVLSHKPSASFLRDHHERALPGNGVHFIERRYSKRPGTLSGEFAGAYAAGQHPTASGHKRSGVSLLWGAGLTSARCGGAGPSSASRRLGAVHLEHRRLYSQSTAEGHGNENHPLALTNSNLQATHKQAGAYRCAVGDGVSHLARTVRWCKRAGGRR